MKEIDKRLKTKQKLLQDFIGYTPIIEKEDYEYILYFKEWGKGVLLGRSKYKRELIGYMTGLYMYDKIKAVDDFIKSKLRNSKILKQEGN